jgi:hypothetical protein
MLGRRVSAVALALLLLALSACASGSGSAQADPTEKKRPDPTTTEATTTTTVSPEQEAIENIANLTDEQKAYFELMANQPQFPPPLAPIPAPPPGTPNRRVEIVQIGPDRQPVFDFAGDPALFAINFDYRDQFVRNEVGDIAIEGFGSLANDDAGQPILLTPERGPDGEFVRELDGRARLLPVGQPPKLNPAFVLGDSVILGTAANLPASLPGWDITLDAQEGRLAGHAAGHLAERRGEIKRVAVVMLGHNSGAAEDHAFHIHNIMDALAGVERIVFVTAAEWGPGQVEWNTAVRDIAASGQYPGMYVADWARVNGVHPEFSYDGLHLTPEGRAELGNLLYGYLGPPPEIP